MLIDEQAGLAPEGSPDDLAADFAARVRRMQAQFDAVLAVSVTSRCNLACRHCGRSCTNDGTDLAPALVTAICRDLPALRPRVKEIGITGGEPLLVPRAVRKLVEAAAACGCAACIMTNGSWATSPAAARRTVRPFPGLHAIVISTDLHHLAFVPVETVRNAYEAGREAGLEVRVLVTLSPERTAAEDALLEQVRTFADADDLMTQKLKPMGRARSISAGFTYSEEPPLIPCTTSGPLIREDGVMIPCCRGLDWLPCAHPMCVGSLHERTLPELFRLLRVHPILHFLRTWGVRQLLDRLAEAGAGPCLPASHLDCDQCHTCSALCASPEVSRILGALKEDSWFRIQVATGRFHVMDEAEMLDLLWENQAGPS
jgi:organic radical activating enzyme